MLQAERAAHLAQRRWLEWWRAPWVTSCLRLQGSEWSQGVASCQGGWQQLQECCLELQCLSLGLNWSLERVSCQVWLQCHLQPWLRRGPLGVAQCLPWSSLLAGAGLQCLQIATREGHQGPCSLSHCVVLPP